MPRVIKLGMAVLRGCSARHLIGPTHLLGQSNLAPRATLDVASAD